MSFPVSRTRQRDKFSVPQSFISQTKIMETGGLNNKPGGHFHRALRVRAKGFFLTALTFSFSSGVAKTSRLPPAVREAAKAVVRMDIKENGKRLGYKTGIAVKSPGGETFIVTDYVGMINGKFFFTRPEEMEFSLENISGEPLTGAYITAFDSTNDLAVIKAPGYKGPALPTADFKNPPAVHEPFYHLAFDYKGSDWIKITDFAEDDLRYTEVLGLTFDWSESFYGYSYRYNDGRTGPLLDGNGALAGLITGGYDDKSYAVFGAKPSALTKLLRTAESRPLRESDSLKELNRQMAGLQSAAKTGNGEAAWSAALLFRIAGNEEEYENYLDLALKAGDGRALYFSAVDLIEREEYGKALPFLRRAVDQGQSMAMFALSKVEENINGNYEEAARLRQKAGERKNPDALIVTASRYFANLFEARPLSQRLHGKPKQTGLDILYDLALNGYGIARLFLESLASQGYRPAGKALKRLDREGAKPLSSACRAALMKFYYK